MLNSIILTFLFAPPIFAALSRQKMAFALIATKDAETLEGIFKKYEREQDHDNLALALIDIAKVQAQMPKVVTCLRVARDPFPNDDMCVNSILPKAINGISTNTDAESFATVITSFKPSDIKPLVAIRFWTLWREDAVKVLKNVMDKSPELITDDLPSWIAFHSLNRNSTHYVFVCEEVFKYLTSFATESVLAKAMSIVKKNEHFKLVYKNDRTQVTCCNSQDYFPQNLFDKIDALLEFMKARKAFIDELEILPKVLVDLMLDYMTVSDCPISTPETSESVLGKRSSLLQSRTSPTSQKKSKQDQ